MFNVSIVIPVRFQDHCWQDLVSQLLKLEGQFEILLVGPDFKDKTSSDERVRFEFCEQGRAKQLNHGAKKANKPYLWFLHADSQISSESIKEIQKKLKTNSDAIYFFDLKFLNDGPRLMRLNGLGASIRSHVLKMPFGDQGLVMAKRTFFSLGQFSESAPYGEDHLLIWKAHQLRIHVLPMNVDIFTSARKYQKNGWLKTTIRHIFLTYLQAFPEWIKCLNMKKRNRATSAIAIFVKTPGVSPVKSRLAATIGKQKAEEFFKLSLKATEAVVMESTKRSKGAITPYWAVAEEEQLQNDLWNSFKTISQGAGSLGERLDTVYSNLQKKHENVFLIGADLPHLNHETVIHAHALLNSPKDFILGETEDGGFYLFGGKQKIEKEVWTSIPYSTEETAKCLVDKLGKDNFIFLEKNFDIDYAEDLKKLASYPIDGLLEEQIEVIESLK